MRSTSFFPRCSASSRSSSFRTNSAQSTRITTELLTVTFQSHKEIIAIGTHVAIHVAVPAMSSIDPEVSRTRASRVHPLEHPCHVGGSPHGHRRGTRRIRSPKKHGVLLLEEGRTAQRPSRNDVREGRAGVRLRPLF